MLTFFNNYLVLHVRLSVICSPIRSARPLLYSCQDPDICQEPNHSFRTLFREVITSRVKRPVRQSEEYGRRNRRLTPGHTLNLNMVHNLPLKVRA